MVTRNYQLIKEHEKEQVEELDLWSCRVPICSYFSNQSNHTLLDIHTYIHTYIIYIQMYIYTIYIYIDIIPAVPLSI